MPEEYGPVESSPGPRARQAEFVPGTAISRATSAGGCLRGRKSSNYQRRSFLLWLLGLPALFWSAVLPFAGRASPRSNSLLSNSPASNSNSAVQSPDPPTPWREQTTAASSGLVAIGHSSEHRVALDRALSAFAAATVAHGDVSPLHRVRRGDVVLLKVNTNSGDVYPYSTSPTVVRALGERLRDLGAQVIIGDRSFWGDGETRENFRRNGIAAAAKKLGAQLLDFDDESTPWHTLPPEVHPHWRGPVRVPQLVVDCDLFINLPCVKTHFITTYTMALKNMLGVVKAGDRARVGNLRSHDQRRIYQQIVEINRFVRPDLHILDGFQALVSGGPTPRSGGGRARIEHTGAVLVSSDPLAIDVVGLALLRGFSPGFEAHMKIAPWQNPLVRAATTAVNDARGPIGIAQASDLRIVGAMPGMRRLRRAAIL